MTNRSRSARRAFALGFAALPLGIARAADDSMRANPPTDREGISQRAAAIHQEVLFAASAERLYRLLTKADEFDRVVRASAAAGAVLQPGAPPTRIEDVVGTPFQLFGGYLSGRQIELVAGERIVRVWRAASWEAGRFSLATFVLRPEGTGTRLVLDHRAFPDDQAEHLASGWKANYWEPIEKVLRAR